MCTNAFAKCSSKIEWNKLMKECPIIKPPVCTMCRENIFRGWRKEWPVGQVERRIDSWHPDKGKRQTRRPQEFANICRQMQSIRWEWRRQLLWSSAQWPDQPLRMKIFIYKLGWCIQKRPGLAPGAVFFMTVNEEQWANDWTAAAHIHGRPKIYKYKAIIHTDRISDS
jgi:hypothetical protein